MLRDTRFVRGSVWPIVAILPLLVAGSCAEPAVTVKPPAATLAPSFSVPVTQSVAVAPHTTAPTMFQATVVGIDGELAERMRTSWRPNCPVPLDELRYVALRHWGFDGRVHLGELVVNAAQTDAIISVFSQLFEARFPIERMNLIDDFAGDDQRSMRSNNTSAFNCREVDGRPGVLSTHAWGTAVDINPLVNPWVRGSTVDPPEGAPFADRSQMIAGGVFPGGVVVRAFASVGWGWGGDWPAGKDWQHFSASGK